MHSNLLNQSAGPERAQSRHTQSVLQTKLDLAKCPTSVEAGLRNFQASFWIALFAPRKRRDRYSTSLSTPSTKHLDDQDVRKRLLDIGSDIPDKAKRGRQPLAALVKSEIARWSPIIKEQTSRPSNLSDSINLDYE